MNKLFCLTFIALLCVVSVSASSPSVWTINSKSDVLKGDARGVSIDDMGAIRLAPRLSEQFKTDQPYVWSSAIDANSNVFLGTGADGKIFKVDASGGKLFADLKELNVSALAIGKNGELFAGTSPDGKVYRIDASGNAAVYFEPKEKYIWSLAILSDGNLAVGTGENGRIFKVKTANASPADSLLYDTSETHIICLAADKSGNLYAGTDANGLVLRFGADGKPFALLDSTLREIHDLSIGADGSIYALALGDSVSVPKPDAAATAAANAVGNTVSADKPTPATPEAPPKSRYDLTAAKSAVYRILPDGGTDVLWNSPTVAAFSITANNNGVLIGTSDKGRIYSVSNEGRETLLLQSNEGQISTLKSNGANIYATSSNQGKLYRFGRKQSSKELTIRRFWTRKPFRIGAESGGIPAAAFNCKPEAATPKNPTKRGARGRRITPTKKAGKSPARKPNICNGGQFCETQTIPPTLQLLELLQTCCQPSSTKLMFRFSPATSRPKF